MIYFLYGDSAEIYEKSNDVINSLIKKNSEATFFKLDQNNFNDFNIDELIGGRSLFTGKHIIYLKSLFENSDTVDFLLKKIKEISESENIFIIAEKKLNKPVLNKIEKNAFKIQTFESKKQFSKKDNSVFDLADAFGNRDTKKLWSLYQQKIKTVRPEEIHGILWWQTKSIVSAQNTNSEKEAGLKPFVFQKSKRFAQKYTKRELDQMSDDLINIVHQSRRSGLELSLSLEKFILKIK